MSLYGEPSSPERQRLIAARAWIRTAQRGFDRLEAFAEFDKAKRAAMKAANIAQPTLKIGRAHV